MKKDDAIQHFGTQQKIADALGILKQAVSAWGEIIPKGKAYELQAITDGKLKVDPDAYVKTRGKSK